MINHHHTENYLATKDRSVTIHEKNIRALRKEIYKVMQKISPLLLNEVFAPRQHNYKHYGNNFLERKRIKSVRYAQNLYDPALQKYGRFHLMR